MGSPPSPFWGPKLWLLFETLVASPIFGLCRLPLPLSSHHVVGCWLGIFLLEKGWHHQADCRMTLEWQWHLHLCILGHLSYRSWIVPIICICICMHCPNCFLAIHSLKVSLLCTLVARCLPCKVYCCLPCNGGFPHIMLWAGGVCLFGCHLSPLSPQLSHWQGSTRDPIVFSPIGLHRIAQQPGESWITLWWRPP